MPRPPYGAAARISASIARRIGSGSDGHAATSAASAGSRMPPSLCCSLHPALHPAAAFGASGCFELELEPVPFALLISGSSVRAREGALSYGDSMSPTYHKPTTSLRPTRRRFLVPIAAQLLRSAPPSDPLVLF